MKVLFVAYYFEPFTGVGAKRISYWAKNLKRVDNDITKCDVITATPQTEKFDNINNVYFVEDTNQGLLRKVIRYDKGASWIYDLRRYIKNNIKNGDYDCVVITGDPFLHFFAINSFKKLGIKTILDFRDPFANNPRGLVKDSIVNHLKSFVLRKIEEYFLSSADYVIAVNECCVELFENYKKSFHKIKIIDNGYDEQLLQNILNQDLYDSQKIFIKLSYAGKLYQDRNPKIFFECLLNHKNFHFYHIGEQSEYIKKDSNQIFSLGFISYEKALQVLASMDVCMIFTSGYAFESTTKIFDYMALKKTICIITDGKVQTGQLHDITQNYPKVYWAKNTQKEIEIVLQSIENNFRNGVEIEFDSYPYSREIGLKKLIKILKEKDD